jgi:ankyrin repeat protein
MGKWEFFPLIHVAVAEGMHDAVAILLRHGARQAAAVHGIFLPALQYAVGMGNMQPGHPSQATIVGMLLDDCAATSSANPHRTVAARSSSVPQCDIDAANDGGFLILETALLTAVKTYSEAAAEQLVAAGANPNLPDAEGYTPLMHAVATSQTELAKSLLESGAADVAAALTREKYTVLHMAVIRRDADLLNFLVQTISGEGRSGAAVRGQATGSETLLSDLNAPEAQQMQWRWKGVAEALRAEDIYGRTLETSISGSPFPWRL